MASINTIHVLVVDADRSSRQRLRDILSMGGARKVSETATPAEAIAALKHPIGLIVVGGSGALAFAHAVRRESLRPSVPIVMVSAQAELAHVIAARDGGVNGLVRAPADARLLLARIASVLADTRVFISSENYVGPDRRRAQAPGYAGPFRRDDDGVDLDDLCA
jgi:two-component system, chemotaxis family, chemotaxis protein CheY